jgi:hypothetical protein
MITGSIMGREFEEASMENLVLHKGIAQAWALLSKTLEGEGYSLVLMGPPGTGKTRLFTTVLNEVEKKWPHGKYVYWSMPEFAEIRRKAVDNYSMDPVDPSLEADICVLDDLGMEKQTEWGLEGLYRIVDWRMRDHRITFIATNLTMAELTEIYGARLVSRFVGKHSTIVKLSGPDWRTREGQELRPIRWVERLNSRHNLLLAEEKELVPMPPEVAEQLRAMFAQKKNDPSRRARPLSPCLPPSVPACLSGGAKIKEEGDYDAQRI